MDYYKLKVLNNKRKILVISFLFIFVGAFLYYYFFINNNTEIILEEEKTKEEEEKEKEEGIYYVDIKGYVSKPGVYSFSFEEDARVNDLILKAGGLKKDADTSLINLSKKLEDEMTVIIYSKSEIEKYLQNNDTLKKKLEICELKLKNNACIKEDVKENNAKVNINTASLDMLITLSGIGEVKAKAIIEYRNKTPFTTIEDIMKVDGISENLFENIKNYITI